MTTQAADVRVFDRGSALAVFEPDGVRKGVPHSQQTFVHGAGAWGLTAGGQLRRQPALLQVDSSECDYVCSQAAQIDGSNVGWTGWWLLASLMRSVTSWLARQGIGGSRI